MTANRPYDEDDLPHRGPDRRADPNRADREISLGTPTILGIFFALALLCACFFGFGYTMGRKSSQSASTDLASDSLAATSGAPKPSAGSASAQPPAVDAQPPSSANSSASEVAVPLASQNNTPAPSDNAAAAKNAVAPADRIIAGEKLPAPASQPATPNLQPATSFVVQIAAVSTQDLADLEVNALTKKGYKVDVRHEPQDKLLHVQIGPFPTKKDAVAMQQRVLADGFNAIVK